MRIHLELTPTITPQNFLLLRKLPAGWDQERLEGALKELEGKELVKVESADSLQRKISLTTRSASKGELEKNHITLDGVVLMRVLEGFIPWA